MELDETEKKSLFLIDVWKSNVLGRINHGIGKQIALRDASSTSTAVTLDPPALSKYLPAAAEEEKPSNFATCLGPLLWECELSKNGSAVPSMQTNTEFLMNEGCPSNNPATVSEGEIKGTKSCEVDEIEAVADSTAAANSTDLKSVSSLQSSHINSTSTARRSAASATRALTATTLHYELQSSKKQFGNHHLLKPFCFGEEHGPLPSRQQPYQIIVHPQVCFITDIHSHLCNSEIIGLLAGKYDHEARCMFVQAAFPCVSTLHATGHTDVEADPVADQILQSEIVAMGLEVVGWYHSHPQFRPDPSLEDITNQWMYQEIFREVRPYVGLIVSSYDSSLPTASALHQWFTVVPYNPTTDAHVSSSSCSGSCGEHSAAEQQPSISEKYVDSSFSDRVTDPEASFLPMQMEVYCCSVSDIISRTDSISARSQAGLVESSSSEQCEVDSYLYARDVLGAIESIHEKEAEDLVAVAAIDTSPAVDDLKTETTEMNPQVDDEHIIEPESDAVTTTAAATVAATVTIVAATQESGVRNSEGEEVTETEIAAEEIATAAVDPNDASTAADQAWQGTDTNTTNATVIAAEAAAEGNEGRPKRAPKSRAYFGEYLDTTKLDRKVLNEKLPAKKKLLKPAAKKTVAKSPVHTEEVMKKMESGKKSHASEGAADKKRKLKCVDSEASERNSSVKRKTAASVEGVPAVAGAMVKSPPSDTIYTSFVITLQDSQMKSSQLARQLLSRAAPVYRGVCLLVASLALYYSRMKKRAIRIHSWWKQAMNISKLQKIIASAAPWAEKLGITAAAEGKESLFQQLMQLLEACWEDYGNQVSTPAQVKKLNRKEAAAADETAATTTVDEITSNNETNP